MFLSTRSLSQNDGPPFGLVIAFGAGALATATVGPLLRGGAQNPAPAPPAFERVAALDTTYPVKVLRVIDGDTFEARVRVWPGLDITTKVRLRGIDAPELRARCPQERVKAEAARVALSSLLAEANVGIMHVSLDKYGGRVVAEASTRLTPNVSEQLFASGHARRYAGGRRESWCPARSS
jgi:endonuclease YncB( thermonuclease family)